MMRRLTTEDSELLRAACAWDKERPSWYREMDQAFPMSDEEFVEALNDWRNLFVGVFDPELSGIILVVWCGDGRFTAHLMAKRRANVELLAVAAEQMLYDLPRFGMQEVSVWIAERNLGVRRLCEAIGIMADGVVMYKGSYRGRVIRWLRHSVRREELLLEKAA